MIIPNKESVEHGGKNFSVKLYDHSDVHCAYYVEAHWHDEYEVIWVTEGELEVSIDGQYLTVKCGEFVIINPHQLHSIRNKTKSFSHHFAAVWGMNLIANDSNDLIEEKYLNPFLHMQSKFINFPFDMQSVGECGIALAEIVKHFKSQRIGWELQVKINVLRLWASLIEESLFESVTKSKKQTQLSMTKAMITYIRLNYSNELGLDEIAESVNVCREYACRVFKKSTGLTIFQYINQTRIRRAYFLLVNTDRKINDIAYSVGFQNMSYFSKVFKQVEGITPKEAVEVVPNAQVQ